MSGALHEISKKGKMQCCPSLNRVLRSLQIFVCAFVLARLAETAWAQKTEPAPALDPVQAQQEARALVAEMLSQKPASTNTGWLKIRKENNEQRQIPMRFEIWSTTNSCTSVYEAKDPGPPGHETRLTVIRTDSQPTKYLLSENNRPAQTLTGNETMVPFAGSDFYIADLGLEFLQWPQQRLIKKEMRRSQFCDVLESAHPRPPSEGYSRVVCWVEQDSPHGIVHADAYDPRGKLFKRFDPTKIEKVQGQYQLQEMEIRNLKAKSKTRIEFDLGN
jgi:hypothetical protein